MGNAVMGQGLKGSYDPSNKESSRHEYFKKVQADLNKRFNGKKKNKPAKEK